MFRTPLRGSVVVVILAVASSSVGAADLSSMDEALRSPFEPARNDIVSANNQIYLGVRDTDFGYAETGDGRLGTKAGKLDTETRWLPGLALSYSVMGNFYLDNVYFNAQVSWDDGKTHYIGSKMGGVYGSVVTSDGATVWDTDFRLGKGFAVRPDVMLTPFLGMGTNSWDRHVDQGERYADDYFGAGLMVQSRPSTGSCCRRAALSAKPSIRISPLRDRTAFPAASAPPRSSSWGCRATTRSTPTSTSMPASIT